MKKQPTLQSATTGASIDELRKLLEDSGYRVVPGDDGTLHLRQPFGSHVRIRRSADHRAVYRVSKILWVVRSSGAEAEVYRHANRVSAQLSGVKCVLTDRKVEIVHESTYSTSESFINALGRIVRALNNGISAFNPAWLTENSANDPV